MIGKSLSHFTISAKLGRGGMGTVYRAEDAKLGREVAIKVLPEAFTADLERLARFEREAKVLASLNHPHIAGIHEVDETEVDGCVVHFLVMELAAGETLAERLARGPLPVDRALAMAQQIAGALEGAHESGIVHRDVKPANVMVDTDGQVKVLDFGLAKVGAAPGETSSDSPTLTAQMTRAGTMLGTAPYMSPEQARGQEVDKRTDIWAFGCVVYEILTGRRAFGGVTSPDTLARILEREPDWEALPDTTPMTVRTLIHRCLAKDPKQRLHDIGDARLEIEDVLARPQEEPPAGSPLRRAPTPIGVRAGLLALGTAALTALLTWFILAPEQVPDPPKGLSLLLDHPLDVMGKETQLNGVLSLTPDGSTLAYQGRDGDTSRLYLEPLDDTPSAPVPGTEGARAPFFSPDGAWLGFVDGTDLKVVPLAGGAPITVGSSYSRSRASWDAHGGVVFANAEGIFRTAIGEPELERIGAPEEDRVLKNPVSLPGGKTVLLASTGPLMGDASRVEVLSVSTGERRVLVENGGSPNFVPSGAAAGGGYLVFGLGGELFAASLDLARTELVGPTVVVVDNVQMLPNGDAAQYSISSTGVLVYATEEGISELVSVDEAGRAQSLSEEQRPFAMPRLSPDESRLAVEVHEVPHQIWLLDIEKDLLSRFTFENSNHYFAWYPDGRSLLFTSDTGDGVRLLWKRVDSASKPVTVYSGDPEAWIVSLSRDGRVAAFHDASDSRNYDVFLLPLDGGAPPQVTGSPIPVATSPLSERDPWVSPDGECVAYVRWEAGTSEVYAACPESGARRQVSAGGGSEPVWSRSGLEIYYRSENRMMVVEVERQPEFRASRPRVLSEGSYRHFDPANYDVSAGGRHFVRLRPVAHSSSARYLPIRLDWFGELEAKVRKVGS